MAIGVFGGTFDPVHIGHLRTALELKNFLDLDAMLLVPCGTPPHRQPPVAAANDRLAMLELAVADEPGLVADGREIRRGGLSFSIDTLVELRGELDRDEPLCFCIGMDSLLSLASWHRWEEYLDYAHIVVVARPGWQRPTQGEIAGWLDRHLVADRAALQSRPAGLVYIDEMTLLPVSATSLREELGCGRSVRYLTTDSVIDYIRNNRLYVPS